MKPLGDRLRRIRRGHDEAGFTLVEMLATLVVLGLALTALAAIVVTTAGATREDGLRTKATQLAQGQLEYLRALPWQYAGLLTASGPDSCYDNELVRVLPSGATSLVGAAPGMPSGFTATRHVTWNGVGCAATQPTYGTLDLFATVSWTVNGVARSVTVSGSRAPLVSEATPSPTYSVSPSPSSTSTTSVSPSTSPTTTSAAPTTSATSASPTPTPTPSFGTTFTSPNPVQICDENGNRDVSATATTFTANIYGGSASDAVTISWYDNGTPGTLVGPYAMAAGSPQSTYVPFSYTVPVGSAFNAGDTYTFKVVTPATSNHAAATFTETVIVAKANNGSNSCSS